MLRWPPWSWRAHRGARSAAKYLNERGMRVLAALDAVIAAKAAAGVSVPRLEQASALAGDLIAAAEVSLAGGGVVALGVGDEAHGAVEQAAGAHGTAPISKVFKLAVPKRAVRAKLKLPGAEKLEQGSSLLGEIKCSVDDVLAAEGYVLGTTANFGYMSGALKHFFDSTFLQVGGALSSTGAADESSGTTAG